MLVVIEGLPFTGKTTLARRLHKSRRRPVAHDCAPGVDVDPQAVAVAATAVANVAGAPESLVLDGAFLTWACRADPAAGGAEVARVWGDALARVAGGGTDIVVVGLSCSAEERRRRAEAAPPPLAADGPAGAVPDAARSPGAGRSGPRDASVDRLPDLLGDLVAPVRSLGLDTTTDPAEAVHERVRRVLDGTPDEPDPLPGRPVVVLGLMSAGKTATGARLAARWRRPMHDSDADLLREQGATAAELAGRLGADGLHDLEAEHLMRRLAAGDSGVICAAASTVERPECREALRPAAVVWLDGDPTVLAARVAKGGHRPVYEQDVLHMLREMDRRRRPLFEEVADVVATVPAPAPVPEGLTRGVARDRELNERAEGVARSLREWAAAR